MELNDNGDSDEYKASTIGSGTVGPRGIAAAAAWRIATGGAGAVGIGSSGRGASSSGGECFGATYACLASDLEILFGPGAQLTKLKDLYQQGEFASEQLVTLVGPRQRIIPNVRILGPVRNYTQIELSYTDGIYLGIDLPLRISGDHQQTPGLTVLGPKGALSLSQGVIRAQRHVHMSQADMDWYQVRDGDEMKLKIDGPCGVTFDRLKVRHHPKVILEVHIDTDEGNSCDLETAVNMELIK